MTSTLWTHDPMHTLAQKIGAYAATLKHEDIPAPVVHQAKRTLIDTIGCAFGGYESETSRIAHEMAQLVSSSQPATILCSGVKTSLDLAAFTNDVMVRYLDYNDGYISNGGGHPSDSISPLLAAAEVAGADGRELLLAIIVTYEVFCRISDAWDYRQNGVDHVIHGGLASLAGAARLMGLTAQQITEAINIYLAGNVALYQTRLGNVSKWKGCAYANASRNALFAVQLAKRGMTGPSPIFEGRNGFFKIVSGNPFELAAFGGKGEPFRIMRTHLKQFPLGNFSQTVVTAILEARKTLKDVRNVAEIRINTTQKALNIMADGPEKWRPQNRETADHSIPYTASVALMFGTIDESYFDEKYFLHNQELLDLVGRVKCNASEEANCRVAEFNLCELEIILRSGERKAVRVEYHRGHFNNPMSDAEVEHKFRTLTTKLLPAARADALLTRLWKLEDLRNMAALMPMTVVGKH